MCDNLPWAAQDALFWQIEVMAGIVTMQRIFRQCCNMQDVQDICHCKQYYSAHYVQCMPMQALLQCIGHFRYANAAIYTIALNLSYSIEGNTNLLNDKDHLRWWHWWQAFGKCILCFNNVVWNTGFLTASHRHVAFTFFLLWPISGCLLSPLAPLPC